MLESFNSMRIGLGSESFCFKDATEFFSVFVIVTSAINNYVPIEVIQPETKNSALSCSSYFFILIEHVASSSYEASKRRA